MRDWWRCNASLSSLLDHAMQEIRVGLKKQIKDSVKLNAYLEQATHDVLTTWLCFRLPKTTRRPDWRRLAAYCRAFMSI